MKLPNSLKRNERICALAKSLKNAALIEHPIDLFYLTGLELSAGSLLITKKSQHLFVDGRYFQVAKEKSPVPVSLTEKASFIEFLKQQKMNTLCFDSKQTSYERYSSLKQLLPKIALEGVPQMLSAQRAIKDAEEIEKMQKSAKLLWKGFLHIKKVMKPGITERELAAEFEIFCKRQGGEGLAFEPIIAFGANSAMPHYRAGNAKLKEGDLVLVDIGVVLDSYHSDMTRIIFFGKRDPELYRLYQIVRRAQKAALECCKEGKRVRDLDRAARKVMRDAGVEDLFVHSLGHGIGLETHEFPRIRDGGIDQDVLLAAGMVITIEPGLYLPGKGGVRYEDTILITENGYQNFYTEGNL